jgi:uncharacterized protein
VLFPDVNVLVGAQRDDESPHAHTMRTWLESALAGPESVGISELVLSGMIRIVTHPRVFAQPSSPSQALQFAEAVVASPRVHVVRPGPRHWETFGGWVSDLRLRGNDIPDAYLASLAYEQGATVVTADRGFKRFGVKLLDPTA